MCAEGAQEMVSSKAAGAKDKVAVELGERLSTGKERAAGFRPETG